MKPWQRRTVLGQAFALLGAVLGLVVISVAWTVFAQSTGYGYDYRAYDAAARRIAAGDPLYLAGTVDAYRNGRYGGLYLYPPQLAIALLPFTLLSQSDAASVWFALRVVLLVAGCAALPVSRRVRLAVFGFGSVSYPVLYDLNLGNVSVVIFVLCAVAWRWMERRAGAAANALLVVLRPPFVIFGLLWLVQGRIRTLVWALGAGVVLVVIALPVIGLSGYADYLGILRGLPDVSAGAYNLSLKSTLVETGFVPAASLAPLVGYVLGVVAILYVGRRRDVSTAFVVTALATVLLSPFMHSHYLVLLLLPAALLADRGQWWALGLPLLGWLPDVLLPLVVPLAIGLTLLASSPPAPRRSLIA